ncbi:MAG: DUF5060 domain-containing protein [Candidatus Omnitrophica bacterium]|nr:DUF5060 domain-containing protein [Candidatus Omnitrophota bacterium]
MNAKVVICACLIFEIMKWPVQPMAQAQICDDSSVKLTIDGSAQTGRYEKIEFQIQLDRDYMNPYDPDEVDLTLELTTPSGDTIILPAFYYQPYEWRRIRREGRETDWFYPDGSPQWRARFAPGELGEYSAVAVLQNRYEKHISSPAVFQTIESGDHGFIRVCEKNPRYFSFSDGTPFFAIGQNLAFIAPGQYLNLQKTGEVFRRMAGNGANFARIWTCSEDWAMAIETRKSAWGRSWDWNPPFAADPGRDGYHRGGLAIRIEAGKTISPSPTYPLALRPSTNYILKGEFMTSENSRLAVLDQTFEWNSKRDWQAFSVPFTTNSDQYWLGRLIMEAQGSDPVLIRSLSLREADGGPELFYEADVNRPPRGVYNPVDCFMLDRVVEMAEQQGVYLQLTLLTRDHYRSDLRDPGDGAYQRAVHDAQNLLRYAVARWGYSTHTAVWEYFNEQDPNLPNESFYRELGRCLEHIDPYHHLRTTSAWGPCPQDWNHDQLDAANEHHYMRPALGAIWRDEVESVWRRAEEIRRHASSKPALLAEFGLADDRWGLSPYMKQDRRGVHFRRCLWASALSGVSGTAMFWWWETIDQLDLYKHYKPVSDFMKNIPFHRLDLQPFFVTGENSGIRLVGLRDSRHAYLWISDPAACWHAQVVQAEAPALLSGKRLSLSGFQPGRYRIQWRDAQQGGVIREESIECKESSINLSITDFTGDIACQITPMP